MDRRSLLAFFGAVPVSAIPLFEAEKPLEPNRIEQEAETAARRIEESLNGGRMTGREMAEHVAAQWRCIAELARRVG